MKKVQRFIGVGDSKPASASLSISPGKSFTNASIASNQLASIPTPTGTTASLSYDSASNHLLPPTQSTLPQQLPSQQSHAGSRQVSPQTSHSLLPPSGASPQPTSPSAQHQYFELPMRATSPSAAVSPRSISPLGLPALNNAASHSALNTTSNSGDLNLVERADLHKSLKAIESLLVNLDEYRDLSSRLAKVQKKLAKSASDLERTKVVQDTPSQTLQLASIMFDGLSDVSSRHAKHVQKEYEAVNDACAKYFKKVAKEERAHDELISTLDAKIKKANAAHEKNVKKASPNKALESHDKYIATVQLLTNDMTRAKNAHALSMTAKSHVSSLLVASTVGGLADVEFKQRCESVRRIGPHIGHLGELLCFTSSEFMPALQASEFHEAEQGQAEYLANLTAQVEASVAVQAQINASINKDAQTILRAQQMGWLPPSSTASQPPTATVAANLARSNSVNSSNSQVSQTAQSNHPAMHQSVSKSNLANTGATPSAATAAAVPRTSSLRLQPQHDHGARSRSNSSSEVEPPPSATQDLPAPTPLEADAASARSIANGHTPRPDHGTSATAQTQSANSSLLLSAPKSTASLVRAPTHSSINSMAARPQPWEAASTSSSSSAVGTSSIQPLQTSSSTCSALQTHDRDGTTGSATEGSFVDRLSVPREDSDAVAPNLSASNSVQSSEDGNRIPRTPDDGEAPPSTQYSRQPLMTESQPQPQHQSVKEQPTTLDYNIAPPVRSAADTDRSRTVASPRVRPAQRALEQYREQFTRPDMSPTTPKFDRDDTAIYTRTTGLEHPDSLYNNTNQHSATSADQSNARKISLWERERERMRQLERNEELLAAQKPFSAATELDGQRPASTVYPKSATSSSFNNNNNNTGWSRSRISDSGANDKTASIQLGLGYPRSSGAEPLDRDLDRYAPAVGTTRLSAVSVTRSLSTDTTASERSFVARMKARYQAEKDLEREQRELNVLEKERAARRVTMDPVSSLSSINGARGRVPEIASRYQTPGAATYAQEVNSGRRYHDSLPASAYLGGCARINAISSSPSAAVANGSVDEFGGIIRDSRALPTGRRSIEPPHSDVCGCHQCSARHYGSGITRGDQAARNNELSASASSRSNPREFNVRSTTMPVLPREQQYAKQPTYVSSSPPRASPRDAYPQQAYTYRDQPQQRLQTPARRDAELPRRSYEDLGSSSDFGSRRVVFAHEPQTIH